MNLHHLVELKYVSALAIFCVAILAAWVPFRQRLQTTRGYAFPRSEALASGVFLGAGLIHMLGDASDEFLHLHVHYPMAFLLAGISFLTLLLLEHYATEIAHHNKASSFSLAILAFVMLSIHSLFAGAALGLGKTFSTTILILIAIIAHKWAASFSLAIQLNKSSQPFKTNLIYFALFVLMTPIGIILGDQISHVSAQHNFIQPVFTALAAGTFLYIGTLHGLKRSVMIERCCNLRDFSFVIIGFALMAVVALWT
jgi:solute carrier family 39 (zinc transporter), member 1/2/3